MTIWSVAVATIVIQSATAYQSAIRNAYLEWLRNMLCTYYAKYCDMTGDGIVDWSDALLMPIFLALAYVYIRSIIRYVRRYFNV